MPRRRFSIVISGPHGDKTGHAMRGAMAETGVGAGSYGRGSSAHDDAQSACRPDGWSGEVEAPARHGGVNQRQGARPATGRRSAESPKDAGHGSRRREHVMGSRPARDEPGGTERSGIRHRIAEQMADDDRPGPVKRAGWRAASTPTARRPPSAIACPARAPDRRDSRRRPSPAAPRTRSSGGATIQSDRGPVAPPRRRPAVRAHR